ncbi:MAG: NUDIX domain-containing protein [Bacteroidetes bacterium]|nr:NUDIX domain-containing protein [Bacteroidota bacterium]
MKIFLNDRIIEFLPVQPENSLATSMVIEYTSVEKLETAWEEFKRYEKFQKLVIIEPEFQSAKTSEAFARFASFFKVIKAAGGLVKNEKGEYLFIHRLGFWDLPKGKIEKKDISGTGNSKEDMPSAQAAAIREVKEETGLETVTISRELAVTWHIYTLKEKWILKKTQWFEMEAGSGQVLKPETREGIFLVKWTPPGAIHCVLSHTYASIRELLVEIIF